MFLCVKEMIGLRALNMRQIVIEMHVSVTQMKLSYQICHQKINNFLNLFIEGNYVILK
jgi:hypothetical protein